jgi:hypothetical protein
MPTLACHPSAWHKVEAECCAQVVQASANNRARHFIPVSKINDDGVAVWQSKLQLKRKKCLLRHTATVG